MNLNEYKALVRRMFGVELKAKTMEEAVEEVRSLRRDESEAHHTRTDIRKPATIDEKERTVDVVIATETPVLRIDWSDFRFYEEVLDMNAVRLDAVKDGQIPLLEAHREFDGLDAQLGSTNNLRVEGDKLVGTRHFSSVQRAQDAWTMTKEGHLNRQSLGYIVHSETVVPAGKTAEVNGRKWTASKELDLRVATDWEPIEDSIVHVPADKNAGTRSAQFDISVVGNSAANEDKQKAREGKERRNMNKKLLAYACKRYGLAAESTEEAVRAEMAKRNETEELLLDAMLAESRADAIRKENEQREESRKAEIRLACKAVGLEEKAEEFIATGLRAEQLSEKFRDALTERSAKVPPAGIISFGKDEKEKVRSAAVDGICLRMGMNVESPASGAETFRGMQMRDICRELLIRNGERPGYDVEQNFKRAIATTDLPHILNNAASRSLMEGFEEQAEVYDQFCDLSGSVSDFREKNVARMLTAVKLEDVPEGGDYPMATVGEDYASVKVGKKGVKFAYTWEAAQNDDLDQLREVPRQFGRAARELEADVAFDFLISNPNLRDGNALFSETHANLAAAGAAPSEATLAAGIRAMGLQTDGEGATKKLVSIRPEVIVAPLSLTTTLGKLLNTQTWTDGAAQSSQKNTVFGSVRPVFDARLDVAAGSSNQPWFLVGPKRYSIKFFYLNGNKPPTVERDWNFDRDIFAVKCRHVFGATVMYWQGLYKNPGTTI